MPRNGSGTFSLVNNGWNPAINGNAATAADWQTLANDIASALTQSLSNDGQTPMIGALNMGGFPISAVGAPSGNGNALRWEQLTKGPDIASAAALPIPNEGALFDVTGTTTITSFSGSYPGRIVYLRFMAAPILTNSASLVMLQGKDLRPFPNEVYAFCNTAPGIWACVGTVNRLPPLYRSGGAITVSTASVSIAPGAWRSGSDATDIILNTALVKLLNTSGSWTPGSGNNGIFSGVAALSTWYHMFVIKNATTGAVDAGFDTSPSGANIPAGWTAARRVGSVFNQSAGGILPVLQTGNIFRFVTPRVILSNAPYNGTIATVNMGTPPGFSTIAKARVFSNANAGGTTSYLLYAPDETRVASGVTAITVSGPGISGLGICEAVTNPSAQLFGGAAGFLPANGLNINTEWYTDFLGD